MSQPTESAMQRARAILGDGFHVRLMPDGELARIIDAIRAEERESIRDLFINGATGEWPDDRDTAPRGWERWWLKLYGEEAGDMLEGDEAWAHFERRLRSLPADE